ncbi:MAG: creatininase family protein [Ruminococcaceae bacterium]|nr:creatininase family protein [Oscillospiraceae bacterium]
MLWENLREEEFEPMLKETHNVCAIAIGCLEMHGQHLPLGTDTLKGGKILEIAAEREPVCVLPRLYYGDVVHARNEDPTQGTAHYGYFALSGELMLQLLEEICDEAARNGFKKILIVSSHGGNKGMLDFFLRTIMSKKKDYQVFSFYNALVMPSEILNIISQKGREEFPYLTDSDIAVLQDFVDKKHFDGHGGFAESALVLGTYPELVRLDRSEVLSGMHQHKTDFLGDARIAWGGSWWLDYPNAYAGHPPTGLTETIAKASVEIAVQKLVRALGVLKNDELMKQIEHIK